MILIGVKVDHAKLILAFLVNELFFHKLLVEKLFFLIAKLLEKEIYIYGGFDSRNM